MTLPAYTWHVHLLITSTAGHPVECAASGVLQRCRSGSVPLTSNGTCRQSCCNAGARTSGSHTADLTVMQVSHAEKEAGAAEAVYRRAAAHLPGAVIGTRWSVDARLQQRLGGHADKELENMRVAAWNSLQQTLRPALLCYAQCRQAVCMTVGCKLSTAAVTEFRTQRTWHQDCLHSVPGGRCHGCVQVSCGLSRLPWPAEGDQADDKPSRQASRAELSSQADNQCCKVKRMKMATRKLCYECF